MQDQRKHTAMQQADMSLLIFYKLDIMVGLVGSRFLYIVDSPTLYAALLYASNSGTCFTRRGELETTEHLNKVQSFH